MKKQDHLEETWEKITQLHVENPYDLLEKGRKYDDLKKRNYELVEALKKIIHLRSKAMKMEDLFPTLKAIKEARELIENYDND